MYLGQKIVGQDPALGQMTATKSPQSAGVHDLGPGHVTGARRGLGHVTEREERGAEMRRERRRGNRRRRMKR